MQVHQSQAVSDPRPTLLGRKDVRDGWWTSFVPYRWTYLLFLPLNLKAISEGFPFDHEEAIAILVEL